MVITHKNIFLRPLTPQDATEFTEAVLESTETLQPWLPWCHSEYTKQDALDWTAFTQLCWNKKTAYDFGIFSNSTQKFLGGVGLNQLNHQHKTCNLGYWVRQTSQRQGIATVAVQALAQFAFNNLGLHRVEIAVAIGNEASNSVARKSGAQFECVAKNKLYLYDKPIEASVFSLVFP